MRSYMCLIGLLAAVTAISFIIVAAQEDNRTILDNIFLNNTTSKDMSLNLSTENYSISSARNVTEVSPINNVFIISSDHMSELANGIGINTSYESPDIKAPKLTTFIIDGFARPTTRDTNFKDQSLINAAYLSRKVEGTPHGYATYYN
jgi:hypothetical protein